MTRLHPQLTADRIVLGRLPLCQLLLNNDPNYRWFIRLCHCSKGVTSSCGNVNAIASELRNCKRQNFSKWAATPTRAASKG